MRGLMAALAVTILTVLIAPSAASAGAFAEPRPFGHACTPQDGVRFCPTTSLEERVPSWDGVPIDVDVTLPAEGNGPWPTIVMLHGVGGSKASFESSSPDGPRPDTATGSIVYHYNNNFYAKRGYAVVNYSARGWGNSCGVPSSRTPNCARGWIQLADQRYELRDAQYLLGLLADQNIVAPRKIGVTGISYGGGSSAQLAFLRNQIRLPNGDFAPWRSPQGRQMEIAAAFPRWQWSDLFEALVRNGRYLDFRLNTTFRGQTPVGIELGSYVNDLLLLIKLEAYLSPVGEDPEADLQLWDQILDRGEPYPPLVPRVARIMRRYKSPVGLYGRRPAPQILQDGFTDDLFPAEEALRTYKFLRARNPDAYVRLQLGDIGHGRAQNKIQTNRYFNDQGARFFDAFLKDEGNPPPNGGVSIGKQTCPANARAGTPFEAPSWDRLHPGAWHVRDGGRRFTITSTGGDKQIAEDLNPATGQDTCTPFPSRRAPGTAVYTRRSPGFTQAGLATVQADIVTRGPYGQLDARLWDVRPDGRQVLVARSGYRLLPNQRGRVTFQLQGNAYHFAKGHTVKLELLGQDNPFLRPSNGTFTIRTGRVFMELPTRERPNRAKDIRCPTFGGPPCTSDRLTGAQPLSAGSCRDDEPTPPGAVSVATPARGCTRPAAATAAHRAVHTSEASVTWTHTSSAGSSSSYWISPTAPWMAIRPATAMRNRRCRRSAPRRQAMKSVISVAMSSEVPSRPCHSIVHFIVSVPMKSSRRTPSLRSPGCGPAAVAAVPANTTTTPHAAIARVAQVLSRSGAGGRDPGSNFARQTSATAAAIRAIDSR
jgi:pimeloyl-ACP methyl ester carboxylesterase